MTTAIEGWQPESAVTGFRLFSVLGGAVTRASLQQAQRDVDTLVDVSCPTSAAPRSATPTTTNTPAASSSAPPLGRVLEVLRGAANAADGGSSTTEHAAAPFSSSSSTHHTADAQVRETLVHALGVARGSALFRECVTAPRRRIQRIVEQLAVTVRARYLPSLTASHNSSIRHDPTLTHGEAVDVHVQLYPSKADPSISAVPTALRTHGGFCAAITVRRLSALQEEASAGQRLQARYMAVAAPGQTLTSSLSFWSDVSYGDTPPPALLHYPPLGFDMSECMAGAAAAAAAPLVYKGRADATGEAERQLGRKSLRAGTVNVTPSAAAATGGTAEEAPSLFLGLPPVNSQQLSAEINSGPSLTQPASLVCASLDGRKGEEAGGNSNVRTAPLPHLTYTPSGVVAVLYVHCSGVAYVGYPPPASSTYYASDVATQGEPRAELTTTGALRGAEGESTAMLEERTMQPRVCTLPMLSSTGFTRALLGFT